MSALGPAPFDWADLAPDPGGKPCPAGVYAEDLDEDDGSREADRELYERVVAGEVGA